MFSVSTFLYKGNAKQYTNDSQSSELIMMLMKTVILLINHMNCVFVRNKYSYLYIQYTA